MASFSICTKVCKVLQDFLPNPSSPRLSYHPGILALLLVRSQTVLLRVVPSKTLSICLPNFFVSMGLCPKVASSVAPSWPPDPSSFPITHTCFLFLHPHLTSCVCICLLINSRQRKTGQGGGLFCLLLSPHQ